MKVGKHAFFLLVAAAMAIDPCASFGATGAVPENDYNALKTKIRESRKDISAVRSWFEKCLKPLAETNGMFTPECREFLNDVGMFNWDGSVTAQQLRKKWGARFDVTRVVPDHPFENGNCGWESRKLAGFEYLGELNDGDWFRLKITGGCRKGDFSESLTRVVKVVSVGGQYRIANLIVP